ncbi:STAS/SEC14 domain-containing protein [Niveibacterium terrae]|uniref:STAS/SEC14 domain-containing protein n=1 Tax=Niveibacterium terrae TaxID=3373598 RepID=UPI003A8E0498
MITAEVRDGRVEAAVFGKLTLDDFHLFEQQIEAQVAGGAPLCAFVDLRAMDGLTLDAAIEDYHFTRRHAQLKGRIAVLTENEFDTIGAWLEQALVEADIRLFDDESNARTWLDSEEA